MQACREDEDDERVVYYDLEDNPHNHNLLVIPDDAYVPEQSRPMEAAGEGNSHLIFRRQRQNLFYFDHSGDEANEENPFDSLLQQQVHESVDSRICGKEEQTHKKSLMVETSKTQSISHDSTRRKTNCGEGGKPHSILKQTHQPNWSTGRITANINNSKKLGFEAANSRPARWSAQKLSAVDTKNRRKSLGAIQRRREQLEASVAKRRKSMPSNLSGPQTAHKLPPTNNSLDCCSSTQKKLLLSDVLQRATLLSQQRQTFSTEACLSQDVAANSTETDIIMDTEHQMRAEPFVPQILSPIKPEQTGTAPNAKAKTEETFRKIHGKIRDVIWKALRKSNREVTLLRSYGQHLLSQQSNHFLPASATDSIQDRAYITICLKRFRGASSRIAAYECLIHDVTASLDFPIADKFKKDDSVTLEAHFHPLIADYLKLSVGKLLKIFEPLHFFPEHVAVGSVSKSKWFLVHTQLTQVIETDHKCSGSRKNNSGL